VLDSHSRFTLDHFDISIGNPIESNQRFFHGLFAMTRLIVDAMLPDKLSTLTEPVDLCNSQGRILGQFFPVLDPVKYDLEPQISDEEIRRRLQSLEPSYTTAEVLARLEKL
jgi:hypothetical protein